MTTKQFSKESIGEKPQISPPAITLPKGGGAIRGIDEKFTVNPATGTASLSVPIPISPGRSGFSPQLSLSYDSGSGNGPFGFGWSLSLPSITRKTDKGLPQYRDTDESDTFILSGAEDLVPVLDKDGNRWKDEREVAGIKYRINRYRPRIEGLFARIERWTNTKTNETHWRSISKDNITTIYGRTTNSRIEDPDAPDGSPRVFSWLICESYDDKGNAIYYEYKEENSEQIDLSAVHERNRTDKSRSANRYIKRIKYCNKTPIKHDSDLPREFREDLSKRNDWLFEVVFDYDEGHYEELPAISDGHQLVKADINPTKAWKKRKDPLSSYRSGFEVRTYRLCRRVLIFHHFPDELGVDDYLVRSTEFNYKESPIASFITSITQSGYKLQADGTYLKKSFPPLEFEYSEASIQDKVEEIDKESLENLPQGLDGVQYQWVDIDGEDLSGILTEQGDSWFYKRNLSPLTTAEKKDISQVIPKFAPVQCLPQVPSFTNLAEGTQQFLDLAGDGQLDIVEFDTPTPGFYERTHDKGWNSFISFKSLPNILLKDPNVRLVDLTGDGHADILMTEEQAFVWYQSLGERGFAQAERIAQALDEEKGPKLVFADPTQSIYLADMSGDGLIDLVRIRNGEVCYWPNLGYGRFGAKVTMDNPPYFDLPDQFDQRRIRLADVDGSGVTDIIYLKNDGAYIYLNESGNSWADPIKIDSLPPIDNLSSVMAIDLLGNGTACLVWSSPLAGNGYRSMRYIDLMGGKKPHLLTKVVNNLGAETRVRYAPSTKFYLADKAAGKEWVTRLPFPVHVVEQVETYDHISKNRFITRYAYHHGYFDGEEREFRGFGMVEQWDSEEYTALSSTSAFPEATNIDEASHVPPVLTRTWFHTGAFTKEGKISRQFEQEYYHEGDPSLGETGLSNEQLQAMLLEDTVLPQDLSPAEAREASRALKGLMLRQEIYAMDRTEEEDRPYFVSERNYTIECLQPRGQNKYAVFFTHPRETIDFHYERKLYDIGGQKLADPRITHNMTLEVDEYGNVLKSVAIGYGRRYPDINLSAEDQAKQTQTLITYTENRVTNAIESDDNDYRTPLPCETRTYELTGYPSTGAAGRFQISDFVQPDPNDPSGRKRIHTFDGEVDYEESPTNGRQRRLIEHLRTLYRPDDLGVSLNDPLALLPLGTVEPLALPGESYKLAFTPGLLAQVYQRPREGQPPENLLPNPNDILPVNLSAGQIADRGGYVDLDSDGHWWIPTGRTFYSPNISDTAEQELTHAREHFFLPQRYRNPFGQTSTVTYDGYDLLMVETRDPLGNCVTSDNDYRVLQPTLVTDPNHNRSAVAFDALGMVVGTAVMGKPEENLGDSLTGFKSDLTQQEIGDFFTDPKGQVGKDLLKDATTRIIYDVHCYKDSEKPIYAATLAREIHVSDLPANDEPKIQVSFSYSDGFGREIQKKIQAEPGPVEGLGEYVDPRWVGSGWTIFNNKGKPVRQYEPFFSNTHRFEFAKTVGVSPILFYDPLERVVATLHPNHTWEKVVFDPWQQETWDVNDTVQDNPKNDKDVGDYFSRLPDEEYLPTWYEKRKDGAMGLQEQSAAEKAAAHANTPTVAYFDTLGRTFLTIAHNGFDDEGNPIKYLTRINLDIEGNQREVIDAMGRVVMRYEYSMAEPDKKEEEREREEEEKEEQQDSHRIYLCSMDAGERWMLNNVAGNPIRKWDSRGHQIRYVYDELQRQTHLFVAQEDGDEILAERTVYGELHPNAEELNLREKIYQQYDGAGVVTNEEYDFKENLLTSKRQLAKIYNQIVNWSSLSNLTDIQGIANAAASLLEGESFTIRNSYDALNRLINQTTPDESKIKFIYNEANLLEKVEARLRGVEEWTTFVKNIDYNAKGQRKKIEYGNGVYTEYKYDPETFRLINLKTIRTADNKKLQDLKYTYDPVGNITEIQDDAQQTIFFNNAVVTPSAQYEYDALYRLIKADGREHAGQNADIQRDHIDFPRMNLPHPNDGQAMRQYTEHYEYDEVGNILKMIHKANNGDWTRRYDYSLKSNRLLSTSLPGDPDEGPFSAVYEYDANGNITKMPHLQQMQWNFKDKLQEVDLGGGGRAYYVYDSDGQRVRKVHEHNGSTVEEHIYLGGYEVYRKQNGNNLNLERETLHIMDDEKRIAIVETKTHDNGMEVSSPTSLMRYQIDNHLGSSSLELDENGKVISYEEYYPYGNTSYHAVRSDIEVSLKRYRYSGKERDEETGLYYYGARYYAAWLGRWVSCDPAGMVDGVNLYEYVLNNPIRIVDYTGTQCYEDIQMCLPLNQCRLPEYTAKSKLFQQNDGSKIEAASHSQNPNLTNVDLKDVKNLSRIGATLTEGGGVLSILSKITNRKRRIKAIKRWTKKLLQILKKSPKGKKLKELKKLLRRVVSAVKNWGKFGRTVRVLRFLGGGFNVMASIVTGVSQYKESPSRKKIFKLIDAAMTTTLSFIVGRSHPIMYAIDICGGIGIEKFYKGAFHGFSAIAEAAFTEESRGLELWYQRIEKGEWGSVYQSIAKVTKEYSEYWGEEGLIGTLIDFKNELLDILIEMERLIKSYGDR